MLYLQKDWGDEKRNYFLNIFVWRDIKPQINVLMKDQNLVVYGKNNKRFCYG